MGKYTTTMIDTALPRVLLYPNDPIYRECVHCDLKDTRQM